MNLTPRRALLDYRCTVAARPLDLRGAIVANLPRGRIETRDQRRLVALSVQWLESLISSVSIETARSLGASLARELERDARSVLENEAEASPEDVGYALSVVLASRGLGLVHFERWGDALALVWREVPCRSEVWRELIASTAAALVSGLTGLDVAGAPIGPSESEVCVLLASRETCEAARRMAREGHSLPQIVASLEPAPEAA